MNVYSELVKAQAENLSSDPVVGKKGRFYYKSTTEPLKIDDGTTFHKVLTDQMYASIATNVVSNLAAGALPLSKTNLSIAIISDVKTSGTPGGSSVGSSWNDRVLNTLSDTDGIATLASNKFTLQAGTYLIEGSAPAYAVTTHKAKLVNVTDSTDAIIGTSAYTFGSDSVVTTSSFSGVVTIAGAKEFKVQSYTGATVASDGLGRNTSAPSTSEVYTTIKITRIK